MIDDQGNDRPLTMREVCTLATKMAKRMNTLIPPYKYSSEDIAVVTGHLSAHILVSICDGNQEAIAQHKFLFDLELMRSLKGLIAAEIIEEQTETKH